LGKSAWRAHKLQIEERILTRSLMDQGQYSIMFYCVRILNLKNP